jgi:hypothetical protein
MPVLELYIGEFLWVENRKAPSIPAGGGRYVVLLLDEQSTGIPVQGRSQFTQPEFLKKGFLL